MAAPQKRKPPAKHHKDKLAPKIARGGPPTGTLIYGFHAGLAALQNPRREIRRVFVTENALARLRPVLEARRLTPQIVTPNELEALLGGAAVHQGLAIEAAPLEQPHLDEVIAACQDKPGALIAILDQVTDPQNVGAVVRSAAAFGVDALILQSRHSPAASAALVKAASGGLEHVPLVEAVNLSRAIAQLKEAGFTCIGFDSDAEQRFTAEVAGSPRLALAFGAEDKGLRRLVREACDTICALAVTGPVKSLNISNAAAIAFHEAVRLRRSREAA